MEKWKVHEIYNNETVDGRSEIRKRSKRYPTRLEGKNHEDKGND